MTNAIAVCHTQLFLFDLGLSHLHLQVEKKRGGMNADPMASSRGSNYVMSRTSEEYERLRRQSELLESITGSVLNGVGLSTGMSCLDLGCGPGEVMRSVGLNSWNCVRCCERRDFRE